MFIVRATGIPYTARASDICAFLADCEVVGGEKGVRLPVSQDGRPNGEAFVLLASEAEVEKALKYNNQYMRERYVGVRQSSKEEMDFSLRFGEYGNVRECMVAKFPEKPGVFCTCSRQTVCMSCYCLRLRMALKGVLFACEACLGRQRLIR